MRHSYLNRRQQTEQPMAGKRGGFLLVFAFLLICASGIGAPGAWAAESGPLAGPLEGSYNANEPIQIQADKAIFNRKEGTSTYIGSVKVDQGRLHLRGDKLVVSRGEGPDPHFTGVMTGDPATLTQDAEKPGQKPMHSHAEKITFDSGTRKLRLEGNAHVEQGNNTLSGETVVYDLRTRQVKASRSENQQVHITLYPDKPPSGTMNPQNKKEDGQ